MTPPVLLFVDGIDGSGKSTLARNIGQALESSALQTCALAVDDFRNNVDWQAAKTSAADVYYSHYFDLALLDKVIEAALAGQTTLSVPVFTEGQARTWRETRIEGCQVIVVEGVFTQRLAAAQKAGIVYVDVDWPLARQRILARDQGKGRPAADVTRRIDERYLPGQRNYVAECRPQTRAHWMATWGKPEQTLQLARTSNPLPAHPLWPVVQSALAKACETQAPKTV